MRPHGDRELRGPADAMQYAADAYGEGAPRVDAIPPVGEIKRWKIEPGDRLVVTVRGVLPDPVVPHVKARVRASLSLPPSFPILVGDDTVSVEVFQAPQSEAQALHAYMIEALYSLTPSQRKDPRTRWRISRGMWELLCLIEEPPAGITLVSHVAEIMGIRVLVDDAATVPELVVADDG